MMGTKTIFREKELWILIAAVLLYFYRPLLLGETLFYRDFFYVFFFPKKIIAEIVRSGQMPLWDPYLDQPLLGLPSIFTTVYPTLLLYMILPPVTALNLDVLLHALLGAFAMYWLARELRLSPLSSLIAGFIFSLGGYVLSNVNLFRLYAAFPYIPLLILFWQRFLLSKNWKWFALAAVSGALQVSTGGIELWLLTIFSLLGWTFSADSEISANRRSLLWLFLLFFISGLSAVNIFANIERVTQSSRALGINFELFSQWSLHPKRLPELIVPAFLGTTEALSNRQYWGRLIEPVYPPFIISIYWGVPCLLLTWIAGTNSGIPNSPISGRIKKFLLGLFIFSIVLSFGKYLFFFQWLYDHLPIKVMRYPIKVMAAGVFPVALLAGCAFEKDFHLFKPSKKNVIIFWIFSVFLITILLLYYLSPIFARNLEAYFFGLSGLELQRPGLMNSFLHAAAFTTLVALLYQLQFRSPWLRMKWMVASVIAADLWIAAISINSYAPAEFFYKEPDILPLIRKEIGDGKLYRDAITKRLRLKTPSDDMVWGARWDLEVLRYYLASSYRIPVIFHEGIDDMGQLNLVKMTRTLHGLPWSNRIPLLSAANVSLILTDEDLQIAGLEKIARIKNQSNLEFYLYRNKNAVGPASFISDAVSVSTIDDALKILGDELFDPKQQVVIQGKVHNSAPNCGPSLVREVASNVNSTTFRVSSPCNGYLVIPRMSYPGWKVFVDGKQTELFTANGIFSAVYLNAGEHDVVRKYRPASWIWGASITLFFAAVLSTIYMRSRRSVREHVNQ